MALKMIDSIGLLSKLDKNPVSGVKKNAQNEYKRLDYNNHLYGLYIYNYTIIMCFDRILPL